MTEFPAWPVRPTADDNGTWLITSRDLPEVTSFVETPTPLDGAEGTEALVAVARDAIATALAFRLDRGEDIPVPSPIQDGEVAVRMPLLADMKLAIRREMKAQGLTQTALAERMKADPRQVRRLLDLHHATPVAGLEAAADALDMARRSPFVPRREAEAA
ncbi:type II toxin-antitoxin system HicB family antitoxin [Roseospirillum parvum]|uniref:Antitoxin HicB n=1 Tax=Roseospirillum parvum TaxID=83401 RepID=A0A1G7ZD43_9PROT|nr:type II toxin-antitoxin system HicB family antitoxin [Roseospirillum parvum]SDH06661.1 antitoxin HicB [Roseospirillum parvum]